MTKPTKDAIAAMTQAIIGDLSIIRHQIDMSDERVEAAWAGIETFVAIGLRVFAQTNPSKLREVMRLVEIQALMDEKEVLR